VGKQRPYSSHNGPRSFAALLFKKGDPEDDVGSITFLDADGKMTWKKCADTGLFKMDAARLYATLSEHALSRIPTASCQLGHVAARVGECAVSAAAACMSMCCITSRHGPAS
jgi:hypothetical protein